MLNQIVVMGRLTRDPVIRSTQSGKTVASFTIACDRDFVSKEGDGLRTDFINVVAWSGAAETIVKHFKKGNLITVSGRLQIREWTKENGEKNLISEINLDRFYFTGRNNNGNKDEAPAESNVNENQYPPVEDFSELEDEGELPF